MAFNGGDSRHSDVVCYFFVIAPPPLQCAWGFMFSPSLIGIVLRDLSSLVIISLRKRYFALQAHR